MRILITGGAGFIGSHLALRLLRQGHEISVVDNMTSGKWENIPFGIRRDGMAVNCDCQTAFISKLSFPKPPDFIYHLAATVGVKRVLDNPKECIENNIDSLRAVLALGIPGMFASTSEVYGKTDGPLHEDSPLLYSAKSRWSYAASKLIGEYLVQQAPGWKSVRFFNVVGPRQSNEYGAVLPRFVSQALEGKALTVYGDGSQVRTFMDVRDTVECLDRLRDKEFDVVNVGGQNVMSVASLAYRVQDVVCGEPPPGEYYEAGIRHIPYQSAYPEGFEECQSRVPDLTKLDSLLPERGCTPFAKTIQDLAERLKPQAVTA